MHEPTLWARRGPIEAPWQLGDLGAADPARAWLVGWDVESVDAGVPQRVALAVARAMASIAKVSALRAGSRHSPSSAWVHDEEGDCTRTTAPSGGLGAVIDWLRGRHRPVTLVCSQRVDAIAGMFDDPAFPWCLQSQVLLLSALHAPPPDVTPEQVLALLDVDWAARAAALRKCGVLAVARPAVDGDALGLLALDGAIAERLVASIAVQARAAGMGWSRAV